MSYYSDLILASSPVAYYRLNEASGATCSDSSGNALDGTYTTIEAYAQAGLLITDIDTCARFNGSTSRVVFGNSISPKLHGASAITAEAWINNDTVPAESVDANIVALCMHGNATGIGIALRGVNLIRAGGRSTSGDAWQYNDVAFATTGVTAHIVVVCDFAADTVATYVNGVLLLSESKTFGSNTYVHDTPTEVDTIGCNITEATFFNGFIDEVAVYATALDAPMILAHYSAAISTAGFARAPKTAIKGYYSIHHLGI